MLGLLAGGLVRRASCSRGTPKLRAQLSSLLEQRATVCSVCSALIRKAQQQQQQQPSSENTAAGRLHSLHHHRLSRKQQLLLVQPARLLQQTTSRVFPGSGKPPPKPQQPVPGESWGYTGAHGVDHWADLFSECNGTSQSPVNIDTSSYVQDDSLTAFSFRNFNTTNGIEWDLQNNGHSAQVTYKQGDLGVSDGGFSSEYKVEQFHFHWGSNDSLGSEHTIDGKQFPMEMHIVTYNSTYGNLTNAVKHGDGLAVLGILFEVGSNDNNNYSGLIKALNEIKEPGRLVSVTPSKLESLMPTKRDEFCRYSGSLTTPPCSEVVTWTLFRQTVPISTMQLDAFRALISSDVDESGVKKTLVDNFRPVQPLYGRQIKCNY